MYRIRLHGRGGQGLKTAGRTLGSALFAEGFEVQDAPRYGAERRGAAIFAYVRAARSEIHERGVILAPDLVIVVDQSLMAVPAAGVLQGLSQHSVVLLASALPAEQWRAHCPVPGPLHTVDLPHAAAGEAQLAGTRCVGAAARLLGVVSWGALESALREELGGLGTALEPSVAEARSAFERFARFEGTVAEGAEHPEPERAADWIELAAEPASASAPDIHGGLTSVQVRTGLWRTVRPVIDAAQCHRCVWMCSPMCPDSAIRVSPDGTPEIDYAHCKGCSICASVCPSHAISLVPEADAQPARELS